MISEYAKSRIDSLSEEDLRHEVSLGSSSRFQREKFAYIQNRLSDLETKRMQENAQASNPANESWVARHTGTLIMALAVIIAPVIGGVILIYSQNLSPPDNTHSQVENLSGTIIELPDAPLGRSPDPAEKSLTSEEITLIEKFSNQVSVEDSVGQLLIVGAAGDSRNFDGNSLLESQIRDLGVGGIMLNSYNYGSVENNVVEPDVVNTMIHYHNHMQSLSLKSPLKLPLFLAVDFEGPAFTSLSGGATQPPAALTLGSTQDGDLIRTTGKIVGYQLGRLGINMLLGPVLDVDRSDQGKSDKTIKNRSFGGNPERVYNSASYYTTGLREAGILAIAKHFPGLGSVQGSLHSLDTLPTYYGGPSRLRDELLPFSNFSKYLDGIMTSHVYLDFLGQKKQKPVTFSHTFVTDLLQGRDKVTIGNLQIEGLGFSSRLIVSDDMTDMGSVIQYRKNNNKSFANIAIEAIDAGHDLLIFSHLEVSNSMRRGRHGDFNLADLNDLVEQMAIKISSNKSLLKKFRHSLKKVIIAKAIMNKRLGGTTPELLSGIRGHWIKNSVQDLSEYMSPDFLKNEGYENTDEFIKDVIRGATIKLNMTENGIENFVDLSADIKIDFYIDERHLDKFSEAFSSKYTRANFIPICRTFKTKLCKEFTYTKGSARRKLSFERSKERWLKATKKRIVDSLESEDVYRIVYTASTLDDIVVFDHARLTTRNSLLSKVMMFVHYTPTIINKELVSKMSIFGAFTKHPLSYQTDIEMLEGKFRAKPIDYLPINFGGDLDALQQRADRLGPAEGFTPIKYYATSRERELSEELQELKSWIATDKLQKSKRTAMHFLVAAFILVFPIIFVLWKIYSPAHEQLADEE